MEEDLKLLSVIVPCYNEEKTVRRILERLTSITLINGVTTEIIVVNDASHDQTEKEILAYQKDCPDQLINYFKHDVNQGKGATIHTGIEKAQGQYLIVQDADLEYDPNEFNDLLKPVFMDNADVVYGSRFMGSNPHRILFFWHTIGNKFLTFLSNMFTNMNLTDMETCYKLFRTDMVRSIKLKEKRFGFEPEVTAKISKISKLRIYEVGISYYGRTYEEGKKIGWKDGIRAIYCILRYNFFK